MRSSRGRVHRVGGEPVSVVLRSGGYWHNVWRWPDEGRSTMRVFAVRCHAMESHGLNVLMYKRAARAASGPWPLPTGVRFLNRKRRKR